MTQDKKILDFAMKYYYLYLNPQTTEGEVTNGFAEACRDLGFSPEGNPYELLPDRRKAGYVFLSEEDAERILENLVDPCTLGSRIFSRWQTTVQRKKEGWKVRLTSHKSRKWFTTAFSGWPLWYPVLGKILLFSMVPSARSASVPVSNRKAGLSVPPTIWSRYSLSIRMEPSGWNAITWGIGTWN